MSTILSHVCTPDYSQATCPTSTKCAWKAVRTYEVPFFPYVVSCFRTRLFLLVSSGLIPFWQLRDVNVSSCAYLSCCALICSSLPQLVPQPGAGHWHQSLATLSCRASCWHSSPRTRSSAGSHAASQTAAAAAGAAAALPHASRPCPSYSRRTACNGHPAGLLFGSGSNERWHACNAKGNQPQLWGHGSRLAPDSAGSGASSKASSGHKRRDHHWRGGAKRLAWGVDKRSRKGEQCSTRCIRSRSKGGTWCAGWQRSKGRRKGQEGWQADSEGGKERGK